MQSGRGKGNVSASAAEQNQRDDVGELAALLAAAKGGQPLRHDVLASLAELLGVPQHGLEDQVPLQSAAVQDHAGLPAVQQRQQEQQQQHQYKPVMPEKHAPDARPPGEPVGQALAPTDFSRRNMARLGGEGVAGIFAGSSAGVL